MFSTFPYKAIKYQFSSDLPLITLTGIGFQNITPTTAILGIIYIVMINIVLFNIASVDKAF